MVAIVVYFESLHQAASYAAPGAAAAATTAAAAATATSVAATAGVVSAARLTAESVADVVAGPSIEELRLRYQQGLDLLLNAADLEQPCMAIFNEYEQINPEALESLLGTSLLKKFRQLELYEVPCYACVSNPEVLVEDVVEGEVELSSAAISNENAFASHSATASLFDFVQTVGFETDFEMLQEDKVKTFTM